MLIGFFHSQVAGGAVSKVDPDSTGLNPAWRDAASHIRVEPTWPDGASLSDITEVRNHLKAVLNTFKSVCGPDSGAYFNEVCCIFTSTSHSKWD